VPRTCDLQGSIEYDWPGTEKDFLNGDRQSPSAAGTDRHPGEGRSLLEWVRVLRDGLPAVAILVLLGIGVGIAVTALQPTLYRSQATLVAGSSRGFLEPEWADGLPAIAGTVTRLASSAAVLEGAGRDYVASAGDAETRARRSEQVAEKDWLEDHLKAEQVADSGIVELAGEAETEDDARALTRAGADSLERQIATGPGSNVPVDPRASEAGNRGIVVRDFKTTDEGQVSPTPVRNVLLGGMVGLVLGIVGGLGLGARRRRLRRPDEMAAELGIPILATVSGDAGKESGKALSAARARLALLGQKDEGTVFLLTGTVRPERTAALGEALARSFAASSRTVLVDADLSGRFASQHLDLADMPGLGDLLNGRATQQRALLRPEQVLVTTVNGNGHEGEIEVLPAGEPPADPAAALSGAALGRSIQNLRLRYDFVLVIGPGLDRPEELIPLASATDWSVLVTPRGERASTFEAANALALTDALAGRVAGAVIVDRK
jgi:Mrp family chromosome partitioning ATPase